MSSELADSAVRPNFELNSIQADNFDISQASDGHSDLQVTSIQTRTHFGVQTPTANQVQFCRSGQPSCDLDVPGDFVPDESMCRVRSGRSDVPSHVSSALSGHYPQTMERPISRVDNSHVDGYFDKNLVTTGTPEYAWRWIVVLVEVVLLLDVVVLFQLVFLCPVLYYVHYTATLHLV